MNSEKLIVKKFEFGPFGTNTYVVNDDAGHVLLVDPACYTPYEQQQLYAYISHLPFAISLLQIVATHGHLDHLWGAPWACEQWHTPVLIHEADIPMAKAMQEQYDMFGVRAQAKPFPMRALKLNDERLAFSGLEILETPGHTPGSICLYWPEEKTLLSGDTLFCMGYGRTDLPGGDTGQLFHSLGQLFALPNDVRVFAGHGEDTTIGDEKR